MTDAAPRTFQPTRPHGARLRNDSDRIPSLPVSTHAPARGATVTYALRNGKPGVSTHAPARGATSHRSRDDGRARVSTHAPARGATRRCAGLRQCAGCFNPRARTGRDSRVPCELRGRPSFNPRARTGRDSSQWQLQVEDWQFQPTRPHGARLGGLMRAPLKAFVSTHAPARGATGTAGRRSRATAGFNPRARTGRDLMRTSYRSVSVMFQPTRPHGARQS